MKSSANVLRTGSEFNRAMAFDSPPLAIPDYAPFNSPAIGWKFPRGAQARLIMHRANLPQGFRLTEQPLTLNKDGRLRDWQTMAPGGRCQMPVKTAAYSKAQVE